MPGKAERYSKGGGDVIDELLVGITIEERLREARERQRARQLRLQLGARPPFRWRRSLGASPESSSTGARRSRALPLGGLVRRLAERGLP